MVEVQVLSQLVNSMYDAVVRLQQAINKNNPTEVNRLRVFIYDLQVQLEKILGEYHA